MTPSREKVLSCVLCQFAIKQPCTHLRPLSLTRWNSELYRIRWCFLNRFFSAGFGTPGPVPFMHILMPVSGVCDLISGEHSECRDHSWCACGSGSRADVFYEFWMADTFFFHTKFSCVKVIRSECNSFGFNRKMANLAKNREARKHSRSALRMSRMAIDVGNSQIRAFQGRCFLIQNKRGRPVDFHTLHMRPVFLDVHEHYEIFLLQAWTRVFFQNSLVESPLSR